MIFSWSDPDSSDSWAELVEYAEQRQLALEFRHEISYRQQFDEYCQWHEQVSTAHRAELASMQNDINIFGWFVRR